MQVSTSLPNQNLFMDLQRVAKWIHKSACKFTQVTKSCKFHAYSVVLQSTCVDVHWVAPQKTKNLRTNLSATKVNASQCKGVAKRNASWTQVENVHWLAPPFVQGFTNEGIPLPPISWPDFLGFLYTLPSLLRMVLTWVQSCRPHLI